MAEKAHIDELLPNKMKNKLIKYTAEPNKPSCHSQANFPLESEMQWAGKNDKQHVLADLLRCQFCTQWEHVSYQMHGNSHKNGLWADLILS